MYNLKCLDFENLTAIPFCYQDITLEIPPISLHSFQMGEKNVNERLSQLVYDTAKRM